MISRINSTFAEAMLRQRSKRATWQAAEAATESVPYVCTVYGLLPGIEVIKSTIEKRNRPNGRQKNNRKCGFWWPEAGSNRRHTDFQSVALPTELSGLCFKKVVLNQNPLACASCFQIFFRKIH